MGIYISEQLQLFLQSIALGAALALLYDLLNTLRPLGRRLWGGALDILFCLTAAASVFLFVMAGSGELRVFMSFGIAGGAVLFRGLLAPLLRPVWSFWRDLALLPFRWVRELLKKMGGKAKKVCTFLRKGFIIKFITPLRKKRSPAQKGDDGMAAAPGGKNPSASRKKPKAGRNSHASGKLTIFFILLLLAGLCTQIFRMFDQLQEARELEASYTVQLADLREENQKLQADLDNSGSMDLIEDIARDQLGMVREGEKIFRYSK